MQNKQELKQIIREAIGNYDLHGRSFTNGLALYKLISDNWINERSDVYGVEEQMIAYIGEDLFEMMESRRLETTMKAMAAIIRIEDLDEIADRLIGEE